MERAEILERLWADSPLFLTREAFEHGLQDWTFHEMHRGGRLVAVFISKGAEFHFTKWDAGYHFTRDDLREWPGGLIERYGYADTRTPKTDTRQRRFNERLGFVQIGEDEFDVHYRITRLRGN